MGRKNIPYEVGTAGESYYSQVGKELRWRWDGQSMMPMLQDLSPQRKGRGPCCYQVSNSLIWELAAALFSEARQILPIPAVPTEVETWAMCTDCISCEHNRSNHR